MTLPLFATPDNDRETEMALALAMEQGWCKARLDADGEVIFFHSDHAPGDATLSIREVAERSNWHWWFEQN